MKLHFTDGMTINTEGPYRVILEKDGYYVVGHGLLNAVEDSLSGYKLVEELEKKRDSQN